MSQLGLYFLVVLPLMLVVSGITMYLQIRLQKKLKTGWWGPKDPMPKLTWPYIWRAFLLALCGLLLCVAVMLIGARVILDTP